MKMELRFIESELRVNPDGTMVVSGYVNKTGQLSEVLGSARKFREKILPGCFARAIERSSRDIDFLTEHDDDRILSSTRNGSLTLREDEQGLFMEAEITPTSYGRDTYELIKAGILRSMSFGMKVLKDHWQMMENNMFERTVEEMELYEVSVVRDPAYSQSTIAARGIHVIEDATIPPEILEEARQMDELKELLVELRKTVDSLTTEVQELRTLKAEVEELRALTEQKEEQEVEEREEEEKEDKEDPEHKEDELENEVKEDENEPEKSSENSESSEEKEEQEEKEEPEKEEEKEEETPDFAAEIAALKNQLALLRQ